MTSARASAAASSSTGNVLSTITNSAGFMGAQLLRARSGSSGPALYRPYSCTFGDRRGQRQQALHHAAPDAAASEAATIRWDHRVTQSLFDRAPTDDGATLTSELAAFTWNNRPTAVDTYDCPVSGHRVPVLTNEFWTSQQRAAHSLHEMSYRACFKPQLPAVLHHAADRSRATRSTTRLRAAGRRCSRRRCSAGCRSAATSTRSAGRWRGRGWRRRTIDEVRAPAGRPRSALARLPEDLLTFYHPDTLAELCASAAYLLERRERGRRSTTWTRGSGWSRSTA